jgi:hypothetical protein
MTRDDFVRLLESRREDAHLDYKISLDWDNCEKPEKVEFVKDILAFANTRDGGRIILGVENSNFQAIGLEEQVLKSLDVTKINGFLKAYTEPLHSCSLSKFDHQGKWFVVIEVPEFSSSPIICKKDFLPENGKPILQAGALYIRNAAGESKRISTAEEMSDVLNRALRGKSTEILRSIETLITGKKAESLTAEWLGESVAKAHKLIDQRIGEDVRKAGNSYRLVVIRPSVDLSPYVPDLAALRDRLRLAKVSYRGWDFPHEQTNTDHGGFFSFDDGIQSFTLWDRDVESYCVFIDGVFVWKAVFWEELWEHQYKPVKIMSYVNLIYGSLEHLMFAERFFNFEGFDLTLDIATTMYNCKGRELVSMEPSENIEAGHICKWDGPINSKLTVTIPQLRSDLKGASSKMVQKLLSYFDYQMEPDALEAWQDKFLSRKS